MEATAGRLHALGADITFERFETAHSIGESERTAAAAFAERRSRR